MNNLAEIMKIENISSIELSKKTGIGAENIRRIMNDRNAVPRYKTVYTVAQIRGEKEI